MIHFNVMVPKSINDLSDITEFFHGGIEKERLSCNIGRLLNSLVDGTGATIFGRPLMKDARDYSREDSIVLN